MRASHLELQSYNQRTLTLLPGRRIGVYEIVALIGAGGMGQVYRGRDTKLHRDVALLNHPNIAHIHGFEESADVLGLAMELVDGDDRGSSSSTGSTRSTRDRQSINGEAIDMNPRSRRRPADIFACR